MIIDLILDRKDDDAQLAQGYTHYRSFTGEILPLAYNPENFYRRVMDYGEIGWDITRAMDGGTEADVKNALCEYIIRNEYNPDLCGYIYTRNWLS